MTRLKMKDLERATGVGRESIRFYIREGLLPEPERPGRNVAWYDESFVERIRLIKELQQKRYLPLQVIKAIVRGDAPPTAREIQTFDALHGRLAPAGDATAVESLAALAARTGVPVAEIRDLAAQEAIAVVTRDGVESVEGAGVRLVELWARLRAAGFTAELGFGPERIRIYVDVVRLLARDELRQFTEVCAGRVDGEELVRMAEDGIRIGSEFLALLRHEALLRFVADGSLAETPPRRDGARVRRLRRGSTGRRS